MLDIFDFDGTIADTAPGVTKCAQVAMVQMGYPELPQEELRTFMGPPLNYSFAQYTDMTPEQIEQAVGLFRERYNTVGKWESSIFPGIPAMLEALKRAGHDLAVASAKPEVYVREIMDHFGLLAYFDSVVGASMDEKSADKENNIRTAMERTGYTGRETEVRMIGDRRFDIEGAKACGVTAVGVLFGYGDREELTAAGADQIVDTVEHLQEALLA